MYVVKSQDGRYGPKNINKAWMYSVANARKFKRKGDATQYLKKSGRHPNDYEIIEITKLNPDKLNIKITALSPSDKPNKNGDIFHVKHVGSFINCNWKVCCARPDASCFGGWRDYILPTKAQAEACKSAMAVQFKCHPDYILIKETYEPCNNNGELPHIRPSWQDYFIGLAYAASQRSHDSQTQHGTIITTKDNHILGTGYNGFPRGLDDATLPNKRPDKYPWMIHSEINALANCTQRPKNGTAYITGEPCVPCLMELHQHGVDKIVCGSKYCWQKENEKDRAIFNKFLAMSKIDLTYVEPNLQWIIDLAGKLEALTKREKPKL